jgi:hypothetical protein
MPSTAPKDAGSGKFDLATHKPPRIDQFGYNKETHKGSELLNKFNPNALAEQVQIPAWWQGKNIRDAAFRATSSINSPEGIK